VYVPLPTHSIKRLVLILHELSRRLTEDDCSLRGQGTDTDSVKAKGTAEG